MVGRPFGAEEHLAAELVDAFEAPLVVVELGLAAEIGGVQAHVGQLDDSDHGCDVPRAVESTPRVGALAAT